MSNIPWSLSMKSFLINLSLYIIKCIVILMHDTQRTIWFLVQWLIETAVGTLETFGWLEYLNNGWLEYWVTGIPEYWVTRISQHLSSSSHQYGHSWYVAMLHRSMDIMKTTRVGFVDLILYQICRRSVNLAGCWIISLLRLWNGFFSLVDPWLIPIYFADRKP